MRISEQEIRKSLKLLSQPPIGSGSKANVDRDVERMILCQLEDVPEIRMEKVISLKNAIEESRYRVSCMEVASEMLGRCLADHLR